jgi:putative membrane protein
MQFFIRILQGALIGLGAVLPGISGGVLCVIFGIYKTIMEFLAEPFRNFKTHVPKLIPIGLGGVIGFLGIANVLSVLLEKYPAPSVCVFVGLIGGMLPSLYREAGEQGRSSASYVSMYVSMTVIFGLLVALQVLDVVITPSFGWYVFCGFCLALSVIAPGMSFSTLLMPLGLYEPFVAGIGHMDLEVLIPGGIGALATVVLFSKVVNTLFQRHYSVAFHAIVGVVISATIMIIPFRSFGESLGSFVSNWMCLIAGILVARQLERFNQKYMVK